MFCFHGNIFNILRVDVCRDWWIGYEDALKQHNPALTLNWAELERKSSKHHHQKPPANHFAGLSVSHDACFAVFQLQLGRLHLHLSTFQYHWSEAIQHLLAKYIYLLQICLFSPVSFLPPNTLRLAKKVKRGKEEETKIAGPQAQTCINYLETLNKPHTVPLVSQLRVKCLQVNNKLPTTIQKYLKKVLSHKK